MGKNILVCSLGRTWAVVPEIVDWINQHPQYPKFEEKSPPSPPEVNEVWLVGTQGGKKVRERLLEIPNLSVRFYICHGVDDITNDEKNEKMAELLLQVLLTARKECDRGKEKGKLYVSLTGGRKTMSAYLQLGTMITQVDGLYHVVANPEVEGKLSGVSDLDTLRKHYSEGVYPIEMVYPKALHNVTVILLERAMEQTTDHYLIQSEPDPGRVISHSPSLKDSLLEYTGKAFETGHQFLQGVLKGGALFLLAHHDVDKLANADDSRIYPHLFAKYMRGILKLGQDENIADAGQRREARENNPYSLSELKTTIGEAASVIGRKWKSFDKEDKIQLGGAEISLQIKGEGSLDLDRDIIRIIFRNLMKNIQDHARPKEGEIILERKGEHLLIESSNKYDRDDPPYGSEKTFKEIAEKKHLLPFSTHRGAEGLKNQRHGVGLYGVKLAAEKYGGEAEVIVDTDDHKYRVLVRIPAQSQ